MADKSKKNSNSGQGQATVVEVAGPGQQTHEHGLTLKKLKKPKWCTKFLIILFTILGVLTLIKSIAVIAVAILTAVATKVYGPDHSGRMVALILLAVTAAVTIAITVYAIVAVFTKKNRPIHVAAVVLAIVAVIQAIIACTALTITEKDQANLSKSLIESFKNSLSHSQTDIKTWSTTQSSLQCCGLYGPEDYRPYNMPGYFPPDVPISCCPTYDASRSDLAQEREREQCKARKEFYEGGCKHLVVEVYINSTSLALHVAIVLIILEVLLCLTGGILSKQRLDKKSDINPH